MILAAGEGKRLRPLTYNTTKALVEVNGKPLLQILIEQLKTAGITKIIVIVNHFKEKIIDYFGNGSQFGVTLTFIEQKERKGNANALLYVESYIKGKRFFLIAIDSLFETEVLSRLLSHRSEGVFTVKEVTDTSRYGTVAIKGKNVLKIVEKSTQPPSNLANFSVYILPREIFEECKHVPLSPRGEYEITDAIQSLIDKGIVFEYEVSKYILDIGTLEQLREAQEIAKKLGL